MTVASQPVSQYSDTGLQEYTNVFAMCSLLASSRNIEKLTELILLLPDGYREDWKLDGWEAF